MIAYELVYVVHFKEKGLQFDQIMKKILIIPD